MESEDLPLPKENLFLHSFPLSIALELCVLKLIHFDCSYNRLIRLPLNLREMNTLIELNVDHNPLETPPASVSRDEGSAFLESIMVDLQLDLYSRVTAYHAFSACRSDERRKTKRIVD